MVLVYSNDPNLTLEMIAKGRELAEEVGGKVTVVTDSGDDPKHFISHGADVVVKAHLPIETFKAEEYADMLASVAVERGCKAVLIGSNKYGKELAPRLAAKLGTGCVTDCTAVYYKDGTLVGERVVYSGNAVSVLAFRKTPGVITIPPRMFKPLEGDNSRSGEVVEWSGEVTQAKSKVVEAQEMPGEGVNVEAADVIVSCGRGFKNREDIKLAEDLASVFRGQAVGCSRPLAADLKWLSEDHWIGLSGHKVKPKLYIAAGISGQIQHIAGIRDADIIVAINKDPEAPIFKAADYGIVGDLYQVLPKLTEAIKKKMA